MTRNTFERSQLFALDQALAARHSMNDPICLQLSNIYHNLVRNWAELQQGVAQSKTRGQGSRGQHRAWGTLPWLDGCSMAGSRHGVVL